jgi:hypothetical protein
VTLGGDTKGGSPRRENGLGSGAQTVPLNEGEWFETADCGQWQKIG